MSFINNLFSGTWVSGDGFARRYVNCTLKTQIGKHEPGTDFAEIAIDLEDDNTIILNPHLPSWREVHTIDIGVVFDKKESILTPVKPTFDVAYLNVQIAQVSLELEILKNHRIQLNLSPTFDNYEDTVWALNHAITDQKKRLVDLQVLLAATTKLNNSPTVPHEIVVAMSDLLDAQGNQTNQ